MRRWTLDALALGRALYGADWTPPGPNEHCSHVPERVAAWGDRSCRCGRLAIYQQDMRLCPTAADFVVLVAQRIASVKAAEQVAAEQAAVQAGVSRVAQAAQPQAMVFDSYATGVSDPVVRLPLRIPPATAFHQPRHRPPPAPPEPLTAAPGVRRISLDDSFDDT